MAVGCISIWTIDRTACAAFPFSSINKARRHVAITFPYFCSADPTICRIRVAAFYNFDLQVVPVGRKLYVWARGVYFLHLYAFDTMAFRWEALPRLRGSCAYACWFVGWASC